MASVPVRDGKKLVPMHTLGSWVNQDVLPGMRILVPECLTGKVQCDGRFLADGEKYCVFDDAYQSFPAPE